MKIIFSGGRNYNGYIKVGAIVKCLNPQQIIVGDCPTGLDSYVLQWANQLNIPIKIYEAEWDKFGKSAGPRRNRKMCEDNRFLSVLIAFPGGRGTENCIKEAKELGIHVLRVDE